MTKNKHCTQWAGTFASAARLSRRGHVVAITLGNTPAYDLVCISPNGVAYKIELKTTNSRNFIRIQKSLLEKPLTEDLFLVVVLLPENVDLSEQFFIMTHFEMRKAWGAVPKIKKSGDIPVAGHEGLTWGLIKVHENQWEKLPK